jgi:aryl-alcohol dehydrogenase-like predicted oxidoreductase
MTVLPQRRLGASGPLISAIGIGTWAMGGPWRMGWGPADDGESLATLTAAFDAGVTFVDTAPVYGRGRAERLVGEAVTGRDDVLVFTKCGLAAEGARADPSAVRESCEQSLERLGRDRIDVLQLHWPDPATDIEDTWHALADLRSEGLVRWLGISNHPLPLIRRAHDVAPVDVVQLRFHLLDQRASADVLPWCRDAGAGALAYSVLASGLLAGSVDLDAVPKDDWRLEDARFALEHASAGPVLEAMPAGPVPPASMATAWALAQPGVDGAIVGCRGPEEVAAAVAAAALTLTADQRGALERAAAPLSLADRPGLR